MIPGLVVFMAFLLLLVFPFTSSKAAAEPIVWVIWFICLATVVGTVYGLYRVFTDDKRE